MRILFFASIIMFFASISSCNNDAAKPNNDTADSVSKVVKTENTNPFFRKDGELRFTEAHTYKEIVKIDIEVADDENERILGLMNRDSIPANAGMLFMMGVEEPQSFWMKNTKIPLDIIYVAADNSIVKICPDAVPYSLNNINSDYPAMFVVEVNGGFAKKHGLKAGDRIIF